jgi:hypothetical protein
MRLLICQTRLARPHLTEDHVATTTPDRSFALRMTHYLLAPYSPYERRCGAKFGSDTIVHTMLTFRRSRLTLNLVRSDPRQRWRRAGTRHDDRCRSAGVQSAPFLFQLQQADAAAGRAHCPCARKRRGQGSRLSAKSDGCERTCREICTFARATALRASVESQT